MPEKRYMAIAPVYANGRVVFPKGKPFTAPQHWGDALVREGRAEALPDELPQGEYGRRDMQAEVKPGKPPRKGRYKRRDMRAKGDE